MNRHGADGDRSEGSQACRRPLRAPEDLLLGRREDLPPRRGNARDRTRLTLLAPPQPGAPDPHLCGDRGPPASAVKVAVCFSLLSLLLPLLGLGAGAVLVRDAFVEESR